MNNSEPDRIWDLFIELRKELIESQKIRSQVMGFKITFITAAIGLMIANISSLEKALFVIPAFAAICFDFIIYSYNFSIKRIGSYCRKHIEPALRSAGHVPEDFTLWQEFLTDPKMRQRLALIGNFGFTLLIVSIGVIALFYPFRLFLSSVLCITLLIFTVMDLLAYRSPRRLGKLWKNQKIHPIEGKTKMDKNKQSFPVRYSGLDAKKVNNTKKDKSLKVVGQSFIVDWSDPVYKKYKENFEEFSGQLASIFGNSFASQKNHHSTILSKALDLIDIHEDQEGDKLRSTIWTDYNFKLCRCFFHDMCFKEFTLRLDKAVIANTGTIQIVLRNNKQLPIIRMFLKGLGAQVKEGTIKGDFINTCTVVLGYFKSANERIKGQIDEAKKILAEWSTLQSTRTLKVFKVSLVEYYDLSLNNFKTIITF